MCTGIIGSSATLGSSTTFEGNILALDSITLNTGARDNCGRVLASTGTVTMNNNTISTRCTVGSIGSGTNGFSGGSGTVVATPEPSTFTILLLGLLPAGLLAVWKLH